MWVGTSRGFAGFEADRTASSRPGQGDEGGAASWGLRRGAGFPPGDDRRGAVRARAPLGSVHPARVPFAIDEGLCSKKDEHVITKILVTSTNIGKKGNRLPNFINVLKKLYFNLCDLSNMPNAGKYLASRKQLTTFGPDCKVDYIWQALANFS